MCRNNSTTDLYCFKVIYNTVYYKLRETITIAVTAAAAQCEEGNAVVKVSLVHVHTV